MTCAAATRIPGDVAVSVRWSEVTRSLVTKYRTDPSARPYALVSLAQYAAVVAAEESVAPCPSARVAVASASVAVLSSLYPDEAVALEQSLREQRVADSASGERGLTGGDAMGRLASAPILVRARTDGVDAAWNGTLPTGPGFWVSNGKPTTPMLGQMTPIVLTSGSQFRPAAPPALSSTAFTTSLAEVKAIAASRTAAQTQLAQQWALSGGTYRTQGHWNAVAADIVSRRGLGEREAARTFALLGAAMNDASIACFDAKYTYSLFRPSQADPTITLAVSLPNHPSYPSSHSCTSGAGTGVLGALFPSEASRLDTMADEIGLSRLYAGIHYRFDIDVGLALGRRVAQHALQVDRDRGLLATLR
jgi:hypothetical protein